jgi:2-C-methyl-D-erythritol 4-phosphate cytidylyltransferase
VVLAADDTHWPGIGRIHDKPVSTCIGGAQRAQSVWAGLLALPVSIGDAEPVLVHVPPRPGTRWAPCWGRRCATP